MKRRAMLLIASLAVVGGCVREPGLMSLQEQLRQREQEVAKLREDLATMQSVLAARQNQITQLQALGDKRLEALFHVERIELGRYTAGYKDDNAPGDRGIRVYLRPIDQFGSVIKAAGDVTVQLFDLAEPPDASLVCQCQYPVDRISQYWASGFVTYHYVFECPWPQGPPRHGEITVRVEFVDYLTGQRFTAQQMVKVALPPAP